MPYIVRKNVENRIQYTSLWEELGLQRRRKISVNIELRAMYKHHLTD